jgi:rhodanese-related sulfurtransferase
MQKLTLLVQVLVSLCLPGCGQKAFDKQLELLYKHTVPLVQPSALALELKQNMHPVLLDVRSRAEYEVSHLPGAVFLDYESFTLNQVKNIPLQVPVVVYCSVGVRSEKIGEQLQQAGYTNVRNVYGGIFKWKNVGLPVVRRPNIPTDSVHVYNRFWGTWLTNGIKVYE